MAPPARCNQLEYYAAVIDHNTLATTFDNTASGTNTFRSNMISLTVNAAKTLTLDTGATLRTSADMHPATPPAAFNLDAL